MLISSGIIYRAYRHDIDVVRPHAAADSEIVETSCGRIEYAALGEGAPVVVVHGAGGGRGLARPLKTWILLYGGFAVLVMAWSTRNLQARRTT